MWLRTPKMGAGMLWECQNGTELKEEGIKGG